MRTTLQDERDETEMAEQGAEDQRLSGDSASNVDYLAGVHLKSDETQYDLE